MAAATTTSSTHTTKTVRGTHHLRIVGYSALLKQASPGESISSTPFHVGGYDWAIRFFPAGKDAKDPGCVGLTVELLSDAPRGAKAWFCIDLLDQDPLYYHDYEPVSEMDLDTKQKRWGYLQVSEDIQPKDGDSITIICTVEVLVQVPATAAGRQFVAVPPPDMSQHLLRFLETKRGCDITFQVEDREFEAHRLLMRMRAPNFTAQSLGPLVTKDGRLYATIADMKADAFEAVLRFIYTDEAPPDVDRLLLASCSAGVAAGDEEDKAATLLTAKVRDLLAAAHRFGLDRMARMCENALCAAMDAENVAATLRIADKLQCVQLKALCVEYMASSPAVLKGVMATEAFQELKDSCPSLLVDLLDKLALA